MAETQHSVRIVKTFPYRGNPVQEFSNRYYFDGGAPADSNAWHALFDGITLLEKSLFFSNVHIISAFGFAPGSDVAVASSTYNLAGTLAVTVQVLTPGDCASVLRMATTKRSTKNHPVYVFSYFHSALMDGGGSGPDTLSAIQKTAIENYGNSWLNGIVIGGRTYKRTTPDGHATTGRIVNQFIGHRDFPA